MDLRKESIAASGAVVVASRRALAASLRLDSELAGLFPGALGSIVRLQVFEPIPERPCVYFLCAAGSVSYVGQTIRIEQRLLVHQRDEKEFDRVFFLDVPRPDLDSVEQAFIRALQPHLNQTRRPYDIAKALHYNDRLTLKPYWPDFKEPSDPEAIAASRRAWGGEV